MKFKHVSRQQVDFKHQLYGYCDNFSYLTDRLRDKGYYLLRQNFFHHQENWDKPGYRKAIDWTLKTLNKELIPCPEYQALPAKVANATLKYVLKDWKGFLRGLFEYYKWIKSPSEKEKYPNKFKARPNPPNYNGSIELSRTDGRNVVHLNYQTMSGGRGKEDPETGKLKAQHGRERSLSIAPLGIITVCSTESEFKQPFHFNLHLQPQLDPLTKQQILDPVTKEVVYRQVEIEEVRIVPRTGGYVVEVCYEEEVPDLDLSTLIPKAKHKYAALDPGLNRLATLVSEGKDYPISFNGKILKSLNSWCNTEIAKAKKEFQRCKSKEQKAEEKLFRLTLKAYKKEHELLKAIKDPDKHPMAYYLQGKKTQEAYAKLQCLLPEIPPYDPTRILVPSSPVSKNSSKKIQLIWLKRDNRIDHYLHDVSREIVDILLVDGVTHLVIGKNVNWKQLKKHMKNFTQIPIARFLQLVAYKAMEAGITVIFQEESYTSKASAWDMDFLPEKYLGKNKGPSFSGKRKGGIYATKDGVRVHSDVNGAINILRKVKEVDLSWVRKVLSASFGIQIPKGGIKTIRDKINKDYLTNV